MPMAESCSTRSGDRAAVRLRWLLIHAPESELPLFLVFADADLSDWGLGGVLLVVDGGGGFEGEED